ncbi:MAG: glycoside hydrolase family 3 C-terminal domain-containing protein [Terriglobia bacterium]
MNRSLSAAHRAGLVIRAMTLDEKIAIVHGTTYPTPLKAYAGYIPANSRLGIPALRLGDGRAGVGDGAKNVTLLPAPIAAAASWDAALLNSYGKVLGEEEWGKGANVALEPTMDIVRVPEWGRSFETYGEDPYLNGQMAAAEIRGIQSQGPIADANMYLTMNQETDRFHDNSVVDERTLQEIYLPPFRAAVEQGGVGTFMCAYVKTNGVYSCENPRLLTDLLRGELHFGGWVMSDWSATHSTLPSARAGLDQEMPSGRYYGPALKAAVESGQISTANLNEHVRRILVTMFQHGLFDKPQPGNWNSDARSRAHDLFSRSAAEQGAVLLKNAGGVLPLAGTTSIAVIGAAGGTKPLAEGGGSSHVVAPYVVSPVDGIRQRAGQGTKVSYAGGNDLNQAASLAQAARMAIVFASAPQSEGSDRPNLDLPDRQDQLISAIAAANPRTVVVLNTGGAILMPWINHVSAVVEAWYPGQEDGNAIAALLFGDVNPSGKLPLTFPRTNSEVPTNSPQQWPGVNRNSDYSEKLQVGYRWYDATGARPLFPFGFGLSYTTFRLSNLVVTPQKLAAASAAGDEKISASVSVTNTGRRAGAEVVEVYAHQPPSNGEPPRELCGFGKVYLKPGETQPVTIALSPRAFSMYDTARREWTSPPGVYTILAGDSSRNLPLHREVTVRR